MRLAGRAAMLALALAPIAALGDNRPQVTAWARRSPFASSRPICLASCSLEKLNATDRLAGADQELLNAAKL